MLIGKGADSTARDSRGRTPLALASRYGNTRIADTLRGGLKADLSFTSVRGCGDPAGIRNGVYYAIDRRSAKAVFPMHGRGRESVYADFAREAANAGIRVPFYCAEFEGDHSVIFTGDRGDSPKGAKEISLSAGS